MSKNNTKQKKPGLDAASFKFDAESFMIVIWLGFVLWLVLELGVGLGFSLGLVLVIVIGLVLGWEKGPQE